MPEDRPEPHGQMGMTEQAQLNRFIREICEMVEGADARVAIGAVTFCAGWFSFQFEQMKRREKSPDAREAAAGIAAHNFNAGWEASREASGFVFPPDRN